MEEPVDAREGRYANVFRVGFNAIEFVFDFGQAFPNAPEQFGVRVITSPLYAREFLRVLGGSVADFEREFGAIPPVER